MLEKQFIAGTLPPDASTVAAGRVDFRRDPERAPEAGGEGV